MRKIPVRVVLVAALLLAGCGHGADRTSGSSAEALLTGWRWTAPRPSYVGMPGADDSGVAVTFGHSHAVLLDPAGQVRWTIDRARLRDVAPRLTGDAVLMATEDGLVSFDRAGGALRWAADLGERASSPVVVSTVAVVSTWDGSLIGVDIGTGSVVWRFALPGRALGSAAVSGGAVLVSWEGDHGAGAGVIAVDASTGRERWSIAVPAGGVSAPGVIAASGAGNVVVVVAGDSAAHGLAPDSGVERWRVDVGGSGSPEDGPLDAGGGAALVADRLGGMALLDAGDGRSRWEAKSDGAAVRGGLAGPGPGGTFALPLEDGRLMLAGPGRPVAFVDPPGRVSGVATGPGGTLLVAVREAADNDLTASTGW